MSDPVSSLVSSAMQKQQADKAIKAQQLASFAQQQQQKEQFDYAKGLNEPFYDLGLPAYKQYASAITGNPMENGQVYKPQESPAYQWQKEQLDKNMNRQLAARGRSNSTYGMNTMAQAYGGLGAQEYNSQLGRLADLSNLARGGASTLTQAGSAYADNTGQILKNSGDQQAAYQLGVGQIYANGIGNINKSINTAVQTGASLYGGGMLKGGGGGDGASSLDGATNSYGVMQNNSGYKWGG